MATLTWQAIVSTSSHSYFASRRLLPRSYSGELPRLANGAYLDFPRVYVIAQELIAHTDGRVDESPEPARKNLDGL